MGNFLVFKATLQPAFAAYAGLTLQHIDNNVRARFMKMHRQGQNRAAASASSSSNNAAASSGSATAMAASHSAASLHPYSNASSAPRLGSYGYELDYPCFALLFPTLTRDESVANFHAWDTDRDGLIDMLEMVSGMILLAAAPFEEKVRALFDLFDVDDSGGLSQRELIGLVLAASGAWEKMLGTERGKGRDAEEMNEAARRAFSHLCVAVPRRKPGSRGARGSPASGGGVGALDEVKGAGTGGAKFMLVSPPGPHVAGGGGGEVPFDKLLIFSACVPLLLQNLCRHHTTDGETARAHWTRLLAAAGNELVTHTGGRGQSTAALLRQECHRVQQLFHSWVPYHRSLILWHAAQRRAAAQASLPASSSTKAAEAAAAAAATAVPELTGGDDALSPSSSHGHGHGRSHSSGGSVSGPPGSATKSRGVGGAMGHLLDDVQSKLTLPTYSSLAKDKRTEGVHHEIKTSLWRPGTASGPRPEDGTGGAGGPGAAGANGAPGAGAGPSSPHGPAGGASGGGGGGNGASKRAPITASGGLDSSLLSGASGIAELEDLRHRPAYLAIKRIKSKVGSRRSKGDPHFAHYLYDKTTLKQAKTMFDAIDRDGSGEIEIAELSSSLEGNPHLGAAISAFKSLDVDQTGTINFGELLRALFPLASGQHVALMCVEVRAIEIGKRDLQVLQQEFEWLDSDFDGKVLFGELLTRLREGWRGAEASSAGSASASASVSASAATTPGGGLNKTGGSGGASASSAASGLPPSAASSGGAVLGALPKQYARDYTPTRAFFSQSGPGTPVGEDRLMSFQECMGELFARSHAHMISDIKRWASGMNVAALTDKQHVELEQLFEIYDLDHSGSIEMDELVQHFTNLGFTESDNARLFRLFDRDGGGSIDLTEFKRFYRSVFDSTKSEDYGRGVTTY